MAARLAISRAQRQLAVEADVHLTIRNFAVINTVGASSLRATLNCDAFATAHSGESHFDRSSFVGLAWRPPKEAICCEIYSTGRSNLPGSISERQLLASFSRMLPELLRFSSGSDLLKLIPEELQRHHRVPENVNDGSLAPSIQPKKKAKPKGPTDVWEGWGDGSTMGIGGIGGLGLASASGSTSGGLGLGLAEVGDGDDDDADLVLSKLGL